MESTTSNNILKNRRILAVDDEADVLNTLEELLSNFEGLVFDKATDYDTGFQLLRSWTYDVVILDIMGVRGFDLLNTALQLGFPTVMLTAHAFSAESLKKSIKMGARAFIPKEYMIDIPEFLKDVISLSYESGLKSFLRRLGSVFDKRFGSRWMEDERDFWNQVVKGEYRPEPTILK